MHSTLFLFLFSFFTPFLDTAKLTDGVDYNKLVRWEKRTLQCEGETCLLSHGDGEFREAECTKRDEGKLRDSPIHDCSILCDGADRDSVISKYPNNNHKCIRFYSYDTLFSHSKWSIWRRGECSSQNITLEVHCGFPEKQRLV